MVRNVILMEKIKQGLSVRSLKNAQASHLKSLHKLRQNFPMEKTYGKDQLPENEKELCITCKASLALPNLENLCAACYIKKKPNDSHLDKFSLQDQSLSQSVKEQFTSSSQQHQEETNSCSIEVESSFEETHPENQIEMINIEVKKQQVQDYFVESDDSVEVKLQCCETKQAKIEQEYMPLKRIQASLFKDKCNMCSRRTGMLGFICNFCGINFCKRHRLPQQHECYRDYVNTCRKRLRDEILSGSIQKKHKGKLQQI